MKFFISLCNGIATYNNNSNKLNSNDKKQIFTIYTLKGYVTTLISWSDWQ